MDVAKSYQRLYTRLMDICSPTEASIKHTFSDKELRVVMGMNKILINDFHPDGVQPARSLYDQHDSSCKSQAPTKKNRKTRSLNR